MNIVNNMLVRPLVPLFVKLDGTVVRRDELAGKLVGRVVLDGKRV